MGKTRKFPPVLFFRVRPFSIPRVQLSRSLEQAGAELLEQASQGPIKFDGLLASFRVREELRTFTRSSQKLRGLRELLLNFKNMLNKAYMVFSPSKANIITFSAAPYSLLVRLRCYPTFDATWHVLPKTPRLPPKHLFPFFQEMSCKLFWTPLPHLHYVLASFHEPNRKKFGKFF